MSALGKRGSSHVAVLAVLSDGKLRTHRDIVKATGLGEAVVRNVLYRRWRSGHILRTKKPLHEFGDVFKGWAGIRNVSWLYHLYVQRPEGIDSLRVDGYEVVGFDEKFVDVRSGGGKKVLMNFQLPRNC